MTVIEGVDDLAAMEDAFNIPRGFIDNLKAEDDWSLIIKSHALLESACADMLCHYFGKYALADVFASLEMSNKRSGKMAFISALNLLGTPERRFISTLSELRNLVAHNASSVTFSLQKYASNLPKEKRPAFINALNIRVQGIILNGDKCEGDELVLTHPNLVLWSSLTWCLHEIYIQDIFSINRNKITENAFQKLKKEGAVKISKEGISISTKGGK